MEANAFSNAYCNSNRKKGKKAVPLWQKKQSSNIDIKKLKSDYDQIEKMEKEDKEKLWLKEIYKNFKG